MGFSMIQKILKMQKYIVGYIVNRFLSKDKHVRMMWHINMAKLTNKRLQMQIYFYAPINKFLKMQANFETKIRNKKIWAGLGSILENTIMLQNVGSWFRKLVNPRLISFEANSWDMEMNQQAKLFKIIRQCHRPPPPPPPPPSPPQSQSTPCPRRCRWWARCWAGRPGRPAPASGGRKAGRSQGRATLADQSQIY